MQDKILVVDDERPIVDIVKYNLEEEGFTVISAYDGEEALRLAFAEKPQLIILDIMMPGYDGFDVCRKIREKMNVPIIMLTAREAEIDKVLGLELGADDYVTKPFSNRELVARVKAALRRLRMQEEPPQLLVCGDLKLSPATMEVWKKDQKVELTHKEFSLLYFLLRHHGFVFSRKKLLQEVWDYDYYGDERTVDVTVRRLREKIEENPGKPLYLHTKRGVGYYLRRP